MRRLAFFISGTGGNALNLLAACRDGRVPGEPVVAVCSSSKAAGIARLEAAGLPVRVVLRSAHPDDETYSEACYEAVEAEGSEVICLCGFLKKLVVPSRWEGRILNIHPGLLPEFGGPGMYGMHVHRAVLAAGAPESGCTIHLVDNQYDHGRILAQARVPVLADDTPEALQQRVYAEEMRLYPEALAAFLRA
ncbi:MAG: Phosphoribosylglycinamide formyltransferase [Acidobacteria bacterium ADurb.Bin340]|nr:MAG: Phosphoribosylglycinamide formyltransferase [Acidobacteria bacterium ADurb.Bin340]HOD33001.1 phosphoribosylglycinamide formyltransferase [Holophaga sp.]HQL47644.1 phosphoribosylglycinamide formyltransferase [Holophaga sp.]